MATIASIVCGIIREYPPMACSLSAGYMVRYNGERIIFSDSYGGSPPHVVTESHNASGRCTSQIVQYEDGSKLHYSWAESRGSRYCEVKSTLKPGVI